MDGDARAECDTWLPNNRCRGRLLVVQLRGPRLRGRREVTLAMGVDAGNPQKATRDLWLRPVARSLVCAANRRLFNTAFEFIKLVYQDSGSRAGCTRLALDPSCLENLCLQVIAENR